MTIEFAKEFPQAASMRKMRRECFEDGCLCNSRNRSKIVHLARHAQLRLAGLRLPQRGLRPAAVYQETVFTRPHRSFTVTIVWYRVPVKLPTQPRGRIRSVFHRVDAVPKETGAR